MSFVSLANRQAWIEGQLTVTEAARFEQTLIDGVGRQRAFGHG